MSDEKKTTVAKNPKREKTESKRIPMGAASKRGLPPEALALPNFKNLDFRKCADYGKGKIQDYLNAGWKHVKNADGENITVPGREKLFLMYTLKKHREEDILANRAKIIETNRKVQRDNAPKKDEYIPNGNDSVLMRDDL